MIRLEPKSPGLPDRLRTLIAKWRQETEILRQNGALGSAQVKVRDANELEEVVRAAEFEMLTLMKAAQESGYAYSTLQQRVADGSIPNAGTKSKPRIRRCDVPRKIKPRGPDLAGEILRGA